MFRLTLIYHKCHFGMTNQQQDFLHRVKQFHQVVICVPHRYDNFFKIELCFVDIYIDLRYKE
jgi:hypothetical protein